MSSKLGITSANHAMRIGLIPKCPISAYNASTPVTESTTKPKINRVCCP
ncbi:Uncharacterised protein [Vibrio cholerae]|nr:Uncharacterised protein [Vibrio cholerae]CSI28704.1 Uncharacterised protein [Vibrio cholerae]